jgi:hypothetical protein
VTFWQKDIYKKAAHKMLMKLTTGLDLCRDGQKEGFAKIPDFENPVSVYPIPDDEK